jgi:hypothetical protein
MNERIKKLAEQAGFDVYGWNENELEEFAVLIVKECADVATINQYQAFTPGYYVKKHFGVEK